VVTHGFSPDMVPALAVVVIPATPSPLLRFRRPVPLAPIISGFERARKIRSPMQTNGFQRGCGGGEGLRLSQKGGGVIVCWVLVSSSSDAFTRSLPALLPQSGRRDDVSPEVFFSSFSRLEFFFPLYGGGSHSQLENAGLIPLAGRRGRSPP